MELVVVAAASACTSWRARRAAVASKRYSCAASTSEARHACAATAAQEPSAVERASVKVSVAQRHVPPRSLPDSPDGSRSSGSLDLWQLWQLWTATCLWGGGEPPFGSGGVDAFQAMRSTKRSSRLAEKAARSSEGGGADGELAQTLLSISIADAPSQTASNEADISKDGAPSLEPHVDADHSDSSRVADDAPPTVPSEVEFVVVPDPRNTHLRFLAKVNAIETILASSCAPAEGKLDELAEGMARILPWALDGRARGGGRERIRQWLRDHGTSKRRNWWSYGDRYETKADCLARMATKAKPTDPPMPPAFGPIVAEACAPRASGSQARASSPSASVQSPSHSPPSPSGSVGLEHFCTTAYVRNCIFTCHNKRRSQNFSFAPEM